MAKLTTTLLSKNFHENTLELNAKDLSFEGFAILKKFLKQNDVRILKISGSDVNITDLAYVLKGTDVTAIKGLTAPKLTSVLQENQAIAELYNIVGFGEVKLRSYESWDDAYQRKTKTIIQSLAGILTVEQFNRFMIDHRYFSGVIANLSSNSSTPVRNFIDKLIRQALFPDGYAYEWYLHLLKPYIHRLLRSDGGIDYLFLTRDFGSADRWLLKLAIFGDCFDSEKIKEDSRIYQSLVYQLKQYNLFADFNNRVMPLKYIFDEPDLLIYLQSQLDNERFEQIYSEFLEDHILNQIIANDPSKLPAYLPLLMSLSADKVAKVVQQFEQYLPPVIKSIVDPSGEVNSAVSLYGIFQPMLVKGVSIEPTQLVDPIFKNSVKKMPASQLLNLLKQNPSAVYGILSDKELCEHVVHSKLFRRFGHSELSPQQIKNVGVNLEPLMVAEVRRFINETFSRRVMTHYMLDEIFSENSVPGFVNKVEQILTDAEIPPKLRASQLYDLFNEYAHKGYSYGDPMLAKCRDLYFELGFLGEYVDAALEQQPTVSPQSELCKVEHRSSLVEDLIIKFKTLEDRPHSYNNFGLFKYLGAFSKQQKMEAISKFLRGDKLSPQNINALQEGETGTIFKKHLKENVTIKDLIANQSRLEPVAKQPVVSTLQF